MGQVFSVICPPETPAIPDINVDSRTVTFAEADKTKFRLEFFVGKIEMRLKACEKNEAQQQAKIKASLAEGKKDAARHELKILKIMKDVTTGCRNKISLLDQQILRIDEMQDTEGMIEILRDSNTVLQGYNEKAMNMQTEVQIAMELQNEIKMRQQEQNMIINEDEDDDLNDELDKMFAFAQVGQINAEVARVDNGLSNSNASGNRQKKKIIINEPL